MHPLLHVPLRRRKTKEAITMMRAVLLIGVLGIAMGCGSGESSVGLTHRGVSTAVMQPCGTSCSCPFPDACRNAQGNCWVCSCANLNASNYWENCASTTSVDDCCSQYGSPAAFCVFVYASDAPSVQCDNAQNKHYVAVGQDDCHPHWTCVDCPPGYERNYTQRDLCCMIQ